MRIKVEKRLEKSALFLALSPFVSVLFALATAGICMIFAGLNPFEAYKLIILESLGTGYGISETLVKSTPLILCGLGVSVAFRMKLWNIGAEGQLFMGAMGASGVALFSGIENSALMLTLMFISAAICGGLWACVSGFLKARFRVNEIIVTLLMNYIAISLVSFLVYGPWKDPKGFNFPITAMFSEAARLSSYFDTRLHGGFIVAICVALFIYVFMEKTIWGYEIRVIGDNPKAAKYAGINYEKAVIGVMFLSGAISGLAGFSEAAGIQFRLQETVSPGYGYTAIIIAWLARRSALGVVVVSFVMGVILVGGDSLQLTWQLPAAFVNLFQGLILFFILASDFFVDNRVRLVRGGR